MKFGVLSEQWNSKNICISALVWVCSPLGSSWVFPTLSHSHGSVYFGITSIFLGFFSCVRRRIPWTAPSPSWETQTLGVGLHLAQDTREKELRAQQGFTLVGTLNPAQFKTSLLRASAEPSLRGWCNWDPGDFSILGSFKKQVRSRGKCSGNNTAHGGREIICPRTDGGGVAKGI